MNYRRFAALLTGVVLCGAAFALDGPDAIRDELDGARASYAAEVAQADEFLDVVLREKEEEARRSDDAALLGRVHAEREAFAARLASLKIAGIDDYLATVAKAREALIAAHTKAAKEYTQAGKAAEAKAVNDALAQLKRPNAPAGSDAPAAPHQAAPSGDNRRLWVQPDGYFVYGSGKDWFEKWAAGDKPPNLLTEVQRTKEFIELQGRHHPVTVRLYADKALMKAEGQVGFKPLYKGGWGEPTE